MNRLILLGFWSLALYFAGNLGGADGAIASILPESMFNSLLKHRNDAACPAKGFYTYRAFINAANAYPAFGNTGDLTTRKREIAAFLGQTSHETTGKDLNALGLNSAVSGLKFSIVHRKIARIKFKVTTIEIKNIDIPMIRHLAQFRSFWLAWAWLNISFSPIYLSFNL